MSIFSELKRRNVFRVGIAYGIASWLMLQIVDVVIPILELPGWAPKLILVIMAVGFVPALIFAWAFELTPEGIKREKEVDRDESITAVTGRKLDRIIIAVLVLAVALLLVDRQKGTDAPEPQLLVEEASEKSIAVLPFVNMSSDAEQEFFSDGITEEILNSLASVKELKVAGRTSSFAFKGQNDDLRKIGDTLGVEHILEGSVRKSGTTVRITAQLIQVDDGFHLWSDTYDRELTDVFAIQDEIAASILRELKARLLDEELDAIASRPTSPEVYDLYLLAKQRIYSRTQQTIESAVELLDKAIEKDPEYAPAYAQRGIATLLLSDVTYGTTPLAEAEVNGRRYLDRALELDPELAEAWAGIGLYHTNRTGDTEEAVTALTRALSINPNLINASNWLFVALNYAGDMEASLALIEDMTSRDPLYRPAFGNGVSTFNDFGMTEEAEELLERFRRFDPNDAQLLQADAMHHFYRGDGAQGLRLAERAIELAPTDNVTRLAYTVGLLQTGQIDRIVKDGQVYFQPFALHLVGRTDDAFDVAHELARTGTIDSLFSLYNITGRSDELVDYLEERWPRLEDFARDVPHDGYGYSQMLDIAIAYSRAGNWERSDEALAFVEAAVTKITEAGVDNFAYLLNTAGFLAMSGDTVEALTLLEQAVERGMQIWTPLAEMHPAFAGIASDPRFAAVEQKQAANINADRAMLDLAPVDPFGEVVH